MTAVNDITLNDANNDFATVLFNGHNVTIDDINDINLGASTASGDATITVGGNITISDLLSSPGTGSSTWTLTSTATAPGGTINEIGNGDIQVPNLVVNAPGGAQLTSPINHVGSLRTGSFIHYVDFGTFNLFTPPTPATGSILTAGAGGFVNQISAQLAAISYVDIPIVKLSVSGFTARVEGNPATILPPGSIATLGLSVPFPDADEQAPRRIEDRSKWVSGSMVVSGSTSAPQGSK
jgi:hypothetical protein